MVRCYPIGVFTMLDQGKLTKKSSPSPSTTPTTTTCTTTFPELPDHMFREMTHFFSVYKMLRERETVVMSPKGVEEAVKIIQKCRTPSIDILPLTRRAAEGKRDPPRTPCA